MKHPAVAVFVLQTAISVAVSIIGYVFEGLAFASSAAVGSSVAIVPQGLFGFWVFRNRGARNARLIARDIFTGEGLKLGITQYYLRWFGRTLTNLKPLQFWLGLWLRS